MNREPTWPGTLVACLLACLAGSLPAAAQAQDPKPETATEKPASGKSEPAPPPRDRNPRKRDSSGEERPRLDVPVSFPVDI